MAKLIAIDAGHGMNTAGKQSVPMSQDLYINGELVRKKGKMIKENEWNRGVSEYLDIALRRCGFRTMFTADMTGKTDTPLSTRANKANNAKADLLISNHYNAIGGCDKWQTRAKGLLVLRTKNCSSNSIKFGELVAKQLNKDIDYEYSYGLMRDVDMSGFTLAILRQSNMPAVLIEYGFMDYEKEAKLMLDKKHQEKCAESVCKAVCEYFGVKYVTKEVAKTQYLRVLQDINIHKTPDFNSDSVCGEVKKGTVVTIVKRIEREGTDMYLVKAGYYITSSSKYVEVFEK